MKYRFIYLFSSGDGPHQFNNQFEYIFAELLIAVLIHFGPIYLQFYGVLISIGLFSFETKYWSRNTKNNKNRNNSQQTLTAVCLFSLMK